MTDKLSELFKSPAIADAYIKYRPTYGSDVYEAIINFCKENASAQFSLAIDVGCGSGQSTIPLTDHFQKVIGLDVSDEQISKAPTHVPNLSFRVGPAEDLSFLDSGSVDLVIVATALHWIDLERFYPEVERVLRPGGALIAYAYGLTCFDEPMAQDISVWFRHNLLGPYWAKGKSHELEYYRNISLPFAGWRRYERLTMEKCWSVEELVGYMSSLSAYQNYISHNPTSCALADLKQRMEAIYQDEKGEERKMRVRWPVCMLMGRKPLA
ncbi:putative methyltransferase DDB_G0268948 isoform X1 [Babylonia areolata]|uniref:putative methyltransferase DDB_G0268948 isoform X1 n=1 Tax=Babylonia areolata TaxID=304850 RepID=UPI003FD3DF0B